MTDEEFDDFIAKTGDELESKQEFLTKTYGLGHYKDFWLDQLTEKLQFKDADGAVKVEAIITPIGSFSHKSNTWQWAWANKSTVEPLRLKAEKLKELSDLTGFETFNDPMLNADVAMAWELAAMAVKILNAKGCYRMPTGQLDVFVAIDSVERMP